jgi:hypothetical protein
MKASRAIRRSALIACMGLMYGVIGCGDSVEAPPELVGTWNATALVVDGFDYVTEGMTLSFTFSSSGDYSYTVTNDGLEFCDIGVPNCSDSGNFDTAGSQITFDPGTTDEETFSYSISGGTLTVNATIDGSVFSFTFQKQ